MYFIFESCITGLKNELKRFILFMLIGYSTDNIKERNYSLVLFHQQSHNTLDHVVGTIYLSIYLSAPRSLWPFKRYREFNALS